MAKRKSTKAVTKLATRAAAPARPAKQQSYSIDLIMGARLARLLGISAVTFWRWRKMEGFPAGLRMSTPEQNYVSVPG
jgi:hypothetical protein